MYSHCFICPTYGHYDYARAAVKSFLDNTPGGVALVVDDGHPEFHRFWDDEWSVIAHRFRNRRGLTRSWNFGLQWAREFKVPYAICGNDDILFTPEWYAGPVALLEDDSVGLVGPLSNAAGRVNARQNVWKHVRNYRTSDEPCQLAKIAARLRVRYQLTDHLKTRAVNGFLMVSSTKRWWEGRFDEQHVFNPARRFALTDNEWELQRRVRRRGWRNVISLRSFVFHYRSVTRGEEFKHGMWYRKVV